jgi:hypothetical protein
MMGADITHREFERVCIGIPKIIHEPVAVI